MSESSHHGRSLPLYDHANLLNVSDFNLLKKIHFEAHTPPTISDLYDRVDMGLTPDLTPTNPSTISTPSSHAISNNISIASFLTRVKHLEILKIPSPLAEDYTRDDDAELQARKQGAFAALCVFISSLDEPLASELFAASALQRRSSGNLLELELKPFRRFPSMASTFASVRGMNGARHPVAVSRNIPGPAQIASATNTSQSQSSIPVIDQGNASHNPASGKNHHTEPLPVRSKDVLNPKRSSKRARFLAWMETKYRSLKAGKKPRPTAKEDPKGKQEHMTTRGEFWAAMNRAGLRNKSVSRKDFKFEMERDEEDVKKAQDIQQASRNIANAEQDKQEEVLEGHMARILHAKKYENPLAELEDIKNAERVEFARVVDTRMDHVIGDMLGQKWKSSTTDQEGRSEALRGEQEWDPTDEFTAIEELHIEQIVAASKRLHNLQEEQTENDTGDKDSDDDGSNYGYADDEKVYDEDLENLREAVRQIELEMEDAMVHVVGKTPGRFVPT